jgi:chorismate-pyruvate lyase
MRLAVPATVLLALAGPAAAQHPSGWTDAPLHRLQALALMQSLSADILAARSATASLERWCGDHRLAPEARIVAEAAADSARSPDAEQMARLQVSRPEEVRYRRVRLRCGERVLSVADNWYVPGRLTHEMNHALESTDTPFGRVVAPLAPYRRTFQARLLWHPLPEGWDRTSALASPCAASGDLQPPDALFEHRAVLFTRDHLPFSEVHEVYQRAILAFPAPLSCHHDPGPPSQKPIVGP